MLARICVARRKPMNSTAPMTKASTVPIPAVTSWRRRSVPLRVIGASPVLLLGQLEAHQGLGGHFDCVTVDDHRRISPALHGADGGPVEHAGGRRLQHLHVARIAL